LCACRVSIELEGADPRRLRIGSHDSLRKSEEKLKAVISEAQEGAAASSKVIDMCLRVLIETVLLPHAQLHKAETLLVEHADHINRDTHEVRPQRRRC
jgi:uncharacterized protein YceK